MGKVEAMNNDGGTVEKIFWGTVPPVSIPPVTNGVKGRMESDIGFESPHDNDDPEWYRRYFKFYTRP